MTRRINWIPGFEVFWGIKRIVWVDGVNSLLPDKKHFLMWDFDAEDKKAVIESLMGQQLLDGLSDIVVLDTGKRYPSTQHGEVGNYHAYCLTTRRWKEAFNIVWDTPYVCKTYCKMAFVREYFTLRFSKKLERDMKLVTILKSPIKPDIHDPKEITNFVRYLTKAK